jgi:predicted nucleic-acid-binding protein
MSSLAGSLDANVILRLLLNDVAEQHAVALLLINSTKNQFAVTDTAIIEVVFVLERHYTFTRAQITEAINGLMSIPVINCNRSLFENALPLFTANTGLSFEDCCLATYATLNAAEPLWTFDQELARKAQSASLLK